MKTTLLLFFLLLPLVIFAQDKKKKASEMSFEEYKKQETQKYDDFVANRLKELEEFIKQEEDWNMITINNKGNVRESTVSSNDDVEENSEKKLVPAPGKETAQPEKEVPKPKKEILPDFVEPEAKPSAAPAGTEKFTHPLKNSEYRVSSSFGYRVHPVYKSKRFHSGIDYAAGKNTPIHAASAGRVIRAGVVRGYGNYVVVQHENNVKTAYAHMHTIDVAKGSTIEKGSIVGTVGMTGTATGNHLHFEVIKNSKKVDPESVL